MAKQRVREVNSGGYLEEPVEVHQSLLNCLSWQHELASIVRGRRRYYVALQD